MRKIRESISQQNT